MKLISEVQQLMVKYHFRPNQKLSQNFIIDKSLLQKIVETAKLSPKDTVLEIGAGTGFLTRALQKHCKVLAVEMDETLFQILQSELPKENLQLIKGNILELDLPPYNKVVSLPPFNISTELVFKLIEHGFDLAVLIFQREFVEKLTAEPGFLDYNATSVIVNYYTEPEIILKNISPSLFYPKPNAVSSMILFKSKKRFGAVKNEQQFVHFVKTLFRLKNKNLSNALLKSYQFIKKDLGMQEKEFKEFVAKLKTREFKVCNLSPKQFVELYKQLYSC